MRLVLLCILTMVAFAANSVLNRLALADGGMGPAAFAAIRLVAGAGILVLLCLWSGGFTLNLRARWGGAAALLLYVLGFSFAYVSLDAGIGALILFGAVQITMFLGAVVLREPAPAQRWAGATLAFGGLVYLFWPTGQAAQPLIGSALMAVAGVGWGVYSLIGRGASNPLHATAGAFVLAAPVALVLVAIAPDAVSVPGVVLAVISGAVTSGLGYALWYTILPALGATRAAVLQLTVPLIAMAGGMVFLGEALTWGFAISSVLVLGGVALSLWKRA